MSPNPVVRAGAWLLTFLLLALFWVMLLRFISLDGVFSSLGKIGVGDTQSIIIITLLPPLATAFVSWAGLRALRTADPAPATALAQAATVAVPAPAADPSEPLGIAAWSAITPLGDAGATLSRCLACEKAFKPDSAIRNDEGHPVHAATIQDLPLEALNFPLATRSRGERVPAMLVSVLDSLFNQQEKLARSSLSTTVYLLQPEALPPEDARQGFAMAWAHSSWRSSKYELHLLPAANSDAYVTINSLAPHLKAGKMQHALLLAADSLVDPLELRAPLALQEVFSNSVPDGFVPAEGGAGLMLVDGSYARESNLVVTCSIGAAQQQQRAADRGAAGKSNCSTLPDSMTAAMVAARAPAEEIGMVVSNTDHRLPRSLEVIQAMEQVLPELDVLTRRLAPMALAGNFGAASDLIHLALAAEAAMANGQPSLAISVSHARNTGAVVITPSMA
ncbi:hypothetical protein SAMN05518865_108207 [Duganella sp. CF458]|uniref:hypothetical protein n=1 Tax=Duganella sp. CF458 TaxID=1884368 RepID=UPI0008E6EDDF|nr:hypothetical protein [Duganella sp. CF458]SFG12161.1 hypothetical protein SAMN05518865_108207 [Duganella sp. CF458]